jgi:hypothetical protein
MPIAGEEFTFEMTTMALLYPGSNGVPTWNPEMPGEKIMRKLPEQFLGMMNDGKAMSEDHGEKLALWARGTTKAPEVVRPIEELVAAGEAIAASGVKALEEWWQKTLTKAERVQMKDKIAALKTIAEKVA